MENIFIFGHQNPDTDSIVSALILEKMEKEMGQNNVKAYRLGKINKETEYVLKHFDITAPELLEEVKEGQKVMMVDHNEFNQSVNGIEDAEILKVVDHHKIANFVTKSPLFYVAMPVGCTATILANLCEINKIEIDEIMAGLMLSAIISDTLLLKSPTCTQKDKETAKKLAKIAEIDMNLYGLDMLKAGTDLSEFTPEELIDIDSKTFTTNGVKYQVSQVNTASIKDVLKDKKEIENAIKSFMKDNEIDLFIFMITDIIKNDSQIIVLGKQEIAENAFDIKLEDNTAYLKGVVSRKKQVIPKIDNNIK